MKKRWIILTSFLSGAVAILIWAFVGNDSQIIVHGDLSNKDVAEIKRVVWKGIGANLRIHRNMKIGDMRLRLKWYACYKIKGIVFTGNSNYPEYAVILENARTSARDEYLTYVVERGTNSWQIRYFSVRE